MEWDKVRDRFGRFFGAANAEPQLSRRDILLGLGLVGVFAAAGPKLLAPSQAAAGILNAGGADVLRADMAEAAADEFTEFSSQPPPRRPPGRPPRRRWRQRFRRRELQARCRRDVRFRRRNPGLCRQALAWRPRRPRDCIAIGPFLICD
jgi:hypothetical protein